MSFPTQVLPDHHRHCDDLFVAAEEAAQRGDWAAAAPAFAHFQSQMQAHFSAEEVVFFRAGDQGDLTRALVEVAADPAASQSRAEAALRRYEEYRWERSAEEYVNVLHALTG